MRISDFTIFDHLDSYLTERDSNNRQSYTTTTNFRQAQSAAMAEIWLWEVGTWKAVGRLQSHSLTVIHLEFSYDDTLLLSVSRDRHFSVFSIQRTSKQTPQLGRVIDSCLFSSVSIVL